MPITMQDLHHIWGSCYIENHIPEMVGALEDHILRVDPLETIIEVGTALGGSARIWEKILPVGGVYVGVDHAADTLARWIGGVRINCPQSEIDAGRIIHGNWELEWQKDNVLKFKSDREIYVVVGDSGKPETAAQVKEILQGRLADFFFHDGAHWGQTPCWDYEWFQHLIRAQGLVCIADIGDMKNRPMSGCQAVFASFPAPKVPEIRNHMQGMGMWIKQEDFVYDAVEAIGRFEVEPICSDSEFLQSQIEKRNA